MNYPKISIVTPSFNQAQFLEETILSVINQNYPNLEYIIIDGGSTDGSVEIIKKYEKYLTYWVSEPDDGHAHALNKGFEKTTGEIMAWLNSDDKYFPWTFKTAAEIFTEYLDVNWITGYQSAIDAQGRLCDIYKTCVNVFDRIFRHKTFIQQESTFWRRSLWEKSGAHISDDYKLFIDGELWARFFQMDKLWTIDRVIGGFRFHVQNRGFTQRAELLKESREISVNLYNSLSPEYKKLCDSIRKYRIFRRAQLIIKTKIRRRLDGIFVLRLLPEFLYRRLYYFLLFRCYKKAIGQEQSSPSSRLMDYCLLNYIDGKWVKNFKEYTV